MIKSISVWAFDPDRPLAEVFQIARKNGFDGVELAVAGTGELTPESTEHDCAVLREAASGAGIQISGLASGMGWQFPLTSTNPETSRKAEGIIAKSLQVARWLGTDGLLVVPGGVGVCWGGDFDGAPYDVAYENLAVRLQSLKIVAEKVRVSIAIENVWNMFLLSPLEMRDAIDRAESKFVGSYFDVGNVVVSGYPEQWVSILGSRIKRVHLKDFKRCAGTVDGFCDLLEGDVDYPAVMSALRTVEYDGALTAEYFKCEDKLPKISSAVDKILSS